MKREWLIGLRKSKQLTQQDEAKKSYINRSFYSHIERGNRNPSIAVAKNIAKVLDFDPVMFLKEEEFKFMNSFYNKSSKLDINLLNAQYPIFL